MKITPCGLCRRVTLFRVSKGTESLCRPQGQRPAVRNDFTRGSLKWLPLLVSIPGLSRVVEEVDDKVYNSDMDVDKVITRAKMQLARRNGVTLNSLSLKQVETVTWPDASLGSPRSGKAYAAVLTEGYRILLSDGRSDFEYHTDGKRRLVLHRVYNQYDKKQDGGAL